MTPPLRTAIRVLLWIATAIEVLGMGGAGIAKFTTNAWPRLFEGWGYPDGFVQLVGALELGGAVLLLVPGLASYAAMLLAVVMVGAIGTLLTHPGSAPALAGPVVHLVLLTAVGVGRWQARTRFGRRPAAAA